MATIPLDYFPERYPDELLYSVLGRWTRHTGVLSPKAAADALFGDRFAPATWDLPCRLGALSSRLNPALKLDAATLISDLTLEPYYTAFASDSVRRSIRTSMTGNAAALHIRLGIVASPVIRPPSARYCVDCNQEALSQYGEYYWHRVHQLPGVLVCPMHRRPLCMSDLGLDTLRCAYHPADQMTCPVDGMAAYEASTNTRIDDTLATIAQISSETLSNPPAGKSLEDLREGYCDLARRAGLFRSQAKADVMRLTEGFRTRFRAVLPLLEGADLTGEESNWLCSMLRKQRNAEQPLRHLLTTLYLEGLPRPTITAKLEDQPYGHGPWQCRNPLAAHFGKDVVTDLKTYRNKSSIVGIFSCRCGYEYTRGVMPNGSLGKPRYRHFGPLLRPVLVSAISNGKSLRDIARSTRLDPKTVATETAALGIATPWTCGRTRRARGTRRQPRSRQVMRRPNRPRRDWQTVDREMTKTVQEIAKDISSESPPIRVSIAEIERRLDRTGAVRRRKRVLFETNKVISTLAESTEAFQRRRLQWAVSRLEAEYVYPPAWRILKLAGLQSAWRDEACRLLAKPNCSPVRTQNEG